MWVSLVDGSFDDAHAVDRSFCCRPSMYYCCHHLVLTTDRCHRPSVVHRPMSSSATMKCVQSDGCPNRCPFQCHRPYLIGHRMVAIPRQNPLHTTGIWTPMNVRGHTSRTWKDEKRGGRKEKTIAIIIILSIIGIAECHRKRQDDIGIQIEIGHRYLDSSAVVALATCNNNNNKRNWKLKINSPMRHSPLRHYTNGKKIFAVAAQQHFQPFFLVYNNCSDLVIINRYVAVTHYYTRTVSMVVVVVVVRRCIWATRLHTPCVCYYGCWWCQIYSNYCFGHRIRPFSVHSIRLHLIRLDTN